MREEVLGKIKEMYESAFSDPQTGSLMKSCTVENARSVITITRDKGVYSYIEVAIRIPVLKTQESEKEMMEKLIFG